MKRIVVPDERKIETESKPKADLMVHVSPDKRKRLDELSRKFKYSVVEILKEWIKSPEKK